MSLGNPVVMLQGVVRRDHTEDVPANPGDPERRQLPRPAFRLRHLTVDTGLNGFSDDAGVADVCFREDDPDLIGKVIVAHGEVVQFLVRPYIATIPFRGSFRRIVRFALVENVGAAAKSPARAAG